MLRRDVIALIGGAAVAWPLAARAQQKPMPLIGFLSSRSSGESARLLAAVRKGLGETDYVEGRNVAIEYRWADGHYDRLPALAADLVDRHVAVIVAGGGAVCALAAKAATTTIPIAFVSGADPVKYGLVASLGRPDANVTGVTMLVGELDTKRLEILRELVPQVALIAVLVNTNSPEADAQRKDMQTAARALGQPVKFLGAGSEGEFERVFATLVQLHAGALLVANDPFFDSQRDLLAAMAARYKVPAIYAYRESADAGGLISYGASLFDMYRQAGVYAGRMLKGEQPADLPVQQATKIELLINVRAARDLGLAIPPSLLARADEVIE